MLELIKVAVVSAVPDSLELAPKFDEIMDSASWAPEFDTKESDHVLEDINSPEELVTGLVVEIDGKA